MIQIQNGRLHLNWLGQGEYPRYVSLRSEFDALQAKLEEFLNEDSHATMRPNQWEVTYFNRLTQGDIWSDPGDWRKIFRGGFPTTVSSQDFIPEAVSLKHGFEIAPRKGRLHVEINYRPPAADQKGEMIFTLTARGPVNDEISLSQGLDIGHEAIVNGFTELTSEEAHKQWERNP